MDSYEQFLQRKTDYGSRHGFEPVYMPEFLFGFQRALVDWAVRLGRAAIFADCGMGKTPMQLVWAQNVVQKTNKPVLILTPLAVSGQTLDEAAKFGIEAHRADVNANPKTIQVTNYEKLQHFDAGNYGGVVCDESSILKNFDGTRKAAITEFMRRVPYRLLCTATAAPNDWIELGTSSEALGYMGHMDMITKFFSNKDRAITWKGFSHFNRGTGRDEYRLRPYAEGPFWQWVSSWARAARKPSDLGFDDDGFILPPLQETHTLVQARVPKQGMLFDLAAVNFFDEREVTRRTIRDRCEAAAAKVAEHDVSMVWCHLNEEGDTLERLIPNSIQVSGSDSEEYKEIAIQWFCGKRCICKDRAFRAKLDAWKRPNGKTPPTCESTIERTENYGISAPQSSEHGTTPIGANGIEMIPRSGRNVERRLETGKLPIRESGRASDFESMGSPPLTMTESLRSKTAGAQSAGAMLPGSETTDDSMLTTTTLPERCADCSVQTATPELESLPTIPTDSNEQPCICGYRSGIRRLVSKPRIFGLGLNLQHCAHMTYFPTHSYEQYYQATRRLWRFGQKQPVVVDLVYTDGGERMMENLGRKAKAADAMFADLTRYMNQAQGVESSYHTQAAQVPDWLLTSANGAL